MESRQRSLTAEATAAMRAAHLLYHRPVVFSDPYALHLTSPALRRVCQNHVCRWLLSSKSISESLRPITAQVVSRARYAEEKLDYLIPTHMWAPQERQALGRILRLIGRRGEPVRSLFEPEAFPGEVSRLGYLIFENISPVDLNKKYFVDRADGLVTHSAAYNIHAQIIKD